MGSLSPKQTHDEVTRLVNAIKSGGGGGGGGSIVAWTQLLEEGEHIANITIDDEITQVFAPTGGGGGGVPSAVEGVSATSHNIGVITNVPIGVNDMIEISFDFQYYQNNCCLFATTQGTEGHNTIHVTLYNNQYYVSGGTGGEGGVGSASVGLHELVFNNESNQLTIDGNVLVSGVYFNAIEGNTYTLACRGKADHVTINSKYYKFKVTDKSTGKIKCDFKPLKYPLFKYNNVVVYGEGYFDLISKTYILNGWTVNEE